MKFKYIVDYQNKTVYAEGTTINGLMYCGKAKCSPNDTFDIKAGKRVARLRAEIKQLTTIRKLMDKRMEETLRLLEVQNNRIAKIEKQQLKKVQQIEEI